MTNYPITIGNKYGRLIVTNKEFCGKRIYWSCVCDCGKSKKVRNDHLVNGKIQSCGCFRNEQSTKRTKILHIANTKTGLSRSQTYNSWCGVKQRCLNPSNKFFSYYGGRGITVCDRWLNSFGNFLEDMGIKPQGMTLDRIDNNGNYEPSNCRWATRKEQMNNRRINRVYTLYGKTFNITQLSEIYGIHRNTLDARLTRGMPIELAIIPPLTIG